MLKWQLDNLSPALLCPCLVSLLLRSFKTQRVQPCGAGLAAIPGLELVRSPVGAGDLHKEGPVLRTRASPGARSCRVGRRSFLPLLPSTSPTAPPPQRRASAARSSYSPPCFKSFLDVFHLSPHNHLPPAACYLLLCLLACRNKEREQTCHLLSGGT